MKRLFTLLLCIILIMLLPMPAMATGEELGDYIGPSTGVWWSFLVVALAIALDTVLGILLGIKHQEFDPRILPQFLFTGVLPFIGGLLLLAILANYIEVPFAGMFYAAAATIAAKYAADVWDKLKLLFGVVPKVPG
jgi:hypothetical protein